MTLAASLASHAVLTRLDLGRNTINAIGAQALRQCLHSNHTLTSLGDLASLPIATGLRASLEWYLRNNAERLESLRVDATPAAEQQEGLLKMLPPEEKALRQKIFKLEDESLRLTKERDAQDAEAAQVNALLTATIQRNAELVDAVATLQGQVDQLRKDALGKRSKSARAKLRKEADKAEKMAEKGVASGPPASRVGSSGGGKKEGGATAGGGTVGAGGRKLGAAAAGSRAAALSKIAAVREAQMAVVRQRAAMTPRSSRRPTLHGRLGGELPSGGIGGRGRGTGVGRGRRAAAARRLRRRRCGRRGTVTCKPAWGLRTRRRGTTRSTLRWAMTSGTRPSPSSLAPTPTRRSTAMATARLDVPQPVSTASPAAPIVAWGRRRPRRRRPARRRRWRRRHHRDPARPRGQWPRRRERLWRGGGCATPSRPAHRVRGIDGAPARRGRCGGGGDGRTGRHRARVAGALLALSIQLCTAGEQRSE